ncbi:MAG: hypothetical protein GEU73_16815 [Chloroflexi bacterium]|nr:hypothetical protein [Chloroflexota bacterium]
MQAVEQLLWIAIVGGGLVWLMLTNRKEPERGPGPEPPPTPVHAERPRRARRSSRPSSLNRREEESRWREIVERLEPEGD